MFQDSKLCELLLCPCMSAVYAPVHFLISIVHLMTAENLHLNKRCSSLFPVLSIIHRSAKMPTEEWGRPGNWASFLTIVSIIYQARNECNGVVGTCACVVFV